MTEISRQDREPSDAFYLPEQTAELNSRLATLQGRFNMGELCSDEQESERDTLLQELNELWPYTDRVMVVTGTVRLPVLDYEEADSLDGDTLTISPVSVVPNNVVGKAVMSKGFTLTSEPMMIGGEHVFDRYIICHDLQVPVSLFLPNNDTEGRPQSEAIQPKAFVLFGKAPLDEVHVDAYPFSTAEGISAAAHYFFPNEAREIDTAIDQHQGNDLRLIRALGKLTFHVSPQLRATDLGILEDHLKRVKFDDAPHRVDLKQNGIVYQGVGEYSVAAYGPLPLFGNLKGVGLVPSVTFTPEKGRISVNYGRFEVCLIMDIFAGRKEYDIRDARVPIRRTSSLISSRSWLLRDDPDEAE